MPNPSPASLVNPTPCQLRALVLDYLCHSCYTKTASAFNKDSTVRPLDADGDEIIDDTVSDADRSAGSYSDERFQTLLQQVRLRQEIRTHIMSGRVDDAIALLDAHFPAVLAVDGGSVPEEGARVAASNVEYISSTSTEPAHLYLNLRILAFSEACRTVPLPYPGTARPDSPAPTLAERAIDDEAYQEQQMALLSRAQKLYAYVDTLSNVADRSIYCKELENVGGLLAYKVPEKSSMAKYLTLERREAVADQINRAILKRTEQPLISSLELVTRHTQVVWQKANELGVKARPGAIIPPRGSKSPPSDNENPTVPTFDLHQFLDAKP